MISRRGMMIGAAAGTALTVTGCGKVGQVVDFAQRMVEIQKRHGGRVGVCALTTAGKTVSPGHVPGSGVNASDGAINIQSDDRFAHCSTFKWLLVTAILQKVDAGTMTLDDAIPYGKADVLEYAPATKAHVSEGHMKLGELCQAAIQLSDNTAANLLLARVGGPAGLTAFARSLGDTVTRFDRIEPDLNSNLQGDPRDTTTPAAMAQLLKTVFLGVTLSAPSLNQLKSWMLGSTTGVKEIRAGVPAGAVVADKTGHGANGAVNDVAVVWPRDASGKTQAPVFLAIYTSGGTLDDDGRYKVVADLTKLVFDMLGFAESLDASSRVSGSVSGSISGSASAS